MKKLWIKAFQDESKNLSELADKFMNCFGEMDFFLTQDEHELFRNTGKCPFCIIILDAEMADDKAFHLCQKIKSDDRLATSPIVFVFSQQATDQMRNKAVESGADAFLHRPFMAAEIKTQINLLKRLAFAENKIHSNVTTINQRQTTETERRYHAYLKHAPYGVFVVNQFGEYTEVNPAACNITGYSEHELLTMQIGDLLAPESKEAGLRHFREISEKGSAYSELQMIKKNHEKRWCSIAAVQVSEMVFLGFKMDITDQKNNILAIAESEMKLKLALKVAKMGYWRYEIATNKVEWSVGHDVLFGIPIEQFQGNLAAVQACVHPDDRAHGEANLANAIAQNKPFENYYRVVHPSGDIRWLFSYGILLKNFNNNGDQIFGITRDVTESKVAEMELKEKNLDNKFLNTLAIKLANIQTGEDSTRIVLSSIKEHTGALGAIFTMYNHENGKYSVKHILTEDRVLNPVLKITGSKILSQEMTLSDEYYQIILKNNVVVYDSFSEISQGQIPDVLGKAINKITGIEKIYGIAHIVSDKFYGGTILAFARNAKLPQNEFLETYAYLVAVSLRRSLAEKELVEARVKAEKSDLLKTAFINNINHEIRTPINGILGFGEILSRTDISREEKEIYFRVFQKSSNRLLQTINDYIDISIIVSGNLQPFADTFSVKQIVDDLKENAELQNEKKKIQMLFDFPANIEKLALTTDRELLKKALNHLMNNAIKFTSEGSVKAGCRYNHDNLEFYFRDTGRGIAPDKLDEIFIPFEKENHALNSGYEGSGLGLAICKGIAKAIGGQLSIKSIVNKGTTVTFSIPHTNTTWHDETIGLDNTIEVARNEQLVLIAEDIEANYFYAKVILETAGFATLYAENGLDAIELCRKNPKISLVLMDIKMPVLNGIDATREILKFRHNLPIIAVTAYAKTGEEHLIRSAGCQDILPKPFKKRELLMKVSKFIKV